MWWCQPPDICRRPVVVRSRDAAVARLGRALEPGDDPVPKRGVVNLDLVESVSVGMIVERLGRLSDVCMGDVCSALAVATDCG